MTAPNQTAAAPGARLDDAAGFTAPAAAETVPAAAPEVSAAGDRTPAERRLLLLAPTARDAQASLSVLSAAGIDCLLCASVERLCRAIDEGAAALVLPEETVMADERERLRRALDGQPVWSDLPVIVIVRAGTESPASARAFRALGNVSLVERPMRTSTLLSLVETALRARERQYQVRDLLTAERRARAEADAANAAKDRFLAVLSHELRTPLSPVALGISAMEGDPDLPPRLHADLAVIRRNLGLEIKLIDDLLDLSRVVNGKLHLRLQPTGVHDLLRHVFTVCAPDLQAKGLSLVSRLEASEDRVTADPARLEQVFWNLIKNAVKFTPAGGEVAVRSWNDDGSQLQVEVSDSGVGIAPELLPRVFDAFEQGDAQLLAWQPGLGLGLAISKALVDLHGGAIGAASAGSGHGSTFLVELPTAAATAAPAAGIAVPAPAPPRARPLRLLIVEDHEDTALLMARILLSYGYRVKSATGVAAALAAAAAIRFDLLISDIGLPDGNGCDLMRQVRRLYGIPGIALSGYGKDEDIQRSREAGFSEHLVKPIDVQQLRAIIERSTAPGHRASPPPRSRR